MTMSKRCKFLRRFIARSLQCRSADLRTWHADFCTMYADFSEFFATLRQINHSHAWLVHEIIKREVILRMEEKRVEELFNEGGVGAYEDEVDDEIQEFLEFFNFCCFPHEVEFINS